MTMIRQEKAYVYLDLGHREYCTITIDKKKNLGMNSDLEQQRTSLLCWKQNEQTYFWNIKLIHLLSFFII